MADETLTVRELGRRVSAALKRAFADEVWVAGEISDLRRSAAGHVYFDLVDPPENPGDAAAVAIPVVLFDQNRRGVNALLRKTGNVRMTDGVAVRIRGFVDFYAPQGRVQIRMTGIDPDYTLGRLAAEREKLVAELRSAGLLERNGSLPLPRSPLVVGLVTSASSAAAADFLHELEVSALHWEVLLADVRVQGSTAEGSIVTAIDALTTRGVEVIAIVRGGGARTDLAVFDSRAIAHKIAACPIPVVTGIGHEIDESVADLVAHSRYKTPTACARALAERVQSEHALFENRWDHLTGLLRGELDAVAAADRDRARSIVDATRRRVQLESQAMLTVGLQLGRVAGEALHGAASEVDRSIGRIGALTGAQLRLADQHLDATEREIGHLDPQRTLERGYSITRADGRVVRDAEEVATGATVTTLLAHGHLESEVSRIVPADGSTDPPLDHEMNDA